MRRREWNEADLRDGIARGEILAYFQPVASLADGSVGGFEALARWMHPELGMIAPDDFIAVAEQCGLIDAITDVILRRGCRAAAEWRPGTTLSINISPVQLRDTGLAGRLLAILAGSGFAPGRLILEIGEAGVGEGETLTALHDAGFRISIGDCGARTGAEQLRRLGCDQIKIASALVQSIDLPESRKAIQTIAGLGKALGMRVAAEGVETREAVAVLRAIGCDLAQGYWFGAPEPIHS